MKFNKVYFFFLFVFFSFSVFSQKKVSVGLSGGVNYSSLRFEDNSVFEHDSEIGYLIGVSTNIHLKNKLSLQVELNYERKVVSVSSDFISVPDPSLLNNSFRVFDIYDFLTLPVMLRYEIGKKNPFFINGGPFLSCFFRARERVNDGELSDDLSEFFTSFDFGFSFGIGKTFLINDSNKLNLELRNNLGLANINRNSDYTKTNSLNFIVGWSFMF